MKLLPIKKDHIAVWSSINITIKILRYDNKINKKNQHFKLGILLHGNNVESASDTMGQQFY